MNPNQFMQYALDLARQGAAAGEVPVAALIVKDNQILSAHHNGVETYGDPTAHAELLAIRSACDILESPRLTDCDLYVTLEPCPMCAAAIGFARIRRLYFAAYDAKGGGVENGPRIFNQPTCHHTPEIYGGIGEHQAGEMLKGFFSGKR